ncbi:MAG: biotin/lipoyl-binding protein, partial [Mariprofundus sp.]
MSQNDEQQAAASTDPVRKWTLMILALAILLLAWHIVADRLTPYTSQARVHALVVPVAAQVSGKVISVAVGNNQQVEAGQELFRIDPDSYQLAVKHAEATLASVQAKLKQSERDAARLKRIRKHDPGAISERRVESALSSLEA